MIFVSPVSRSTSTSAAPTINGGGEIGELFVTVASRAIPFPHMEAVAISARETCEVSEDSADPLFSGLPAPSFAASSAPVFMSVSSLLPGTLLPASLFFSLRTTFPSNTTSFSGQFIICAPSLQICSRTCSAHFSTAFPVTYVVLDA